MGGCHNFYKNTCSTFLLSFFDMLRVGSSVGLAYPINIQLREGGPHNISAPLISSLIKYTWNTLTTFKQLLCGNNE